jgi:hypothetical protein
MNTDSINDIGHSNVIMLEKNYRRVYTGPFNDGRGNPNVRFYGFILEQFFYFLAFYLLIKYKVKHAVLFTIFLIFGSLLNGIRFYYVNPLNQGKSDAKFLDYVFYQNALNLLLGVLVVIYLLIIKK